MFTCPAPPPLHQPSLDRPRYELTVNVAPDLRHVTGEETVAFTPNRATDRLVFRLWANGPAQLAEGSRLDVNRETLDGKPASVRRPNPTTVVFVSTVQRGQTVTAKLSWQLRVPTRGRDRIAAFHDGLRLGSFFPILAWDDRRGWVSDPPTRVLAETSTSPTADIDVRLRVPTGMDAVVSGTQAAAGEWRAHAVRDVAVAVGRFASATAVVRLPHPVAVRAVVVGRSQNAQTIVRLATRALRHYVKTYGPYPWDTYTLAGNPDIPNEGIEYPTLTFVGPGSLERVVVDHETAHQWFYSLVGNDQARDPWLDEALATWAQERLDGVDGEGFYGTARHVGAPMTYWAGRARQYYREVYGGGPEALRSLHAPAKVDCALRFYVARDGYRIAQPADLLAELDRFIPGASASLRRFGIHA